MVKKIFEFMRDNPYLTIIGLMLIFVMILVAQSRSENKSPEPKDPIVVEMEEDYKVLAESRDLKYYREYGKYYVLVSDLAFNDEQIIRNTLAIPDDVYFEIIIPGALLREYSEKEFNYQD